MSFDSNQRLRTDGYPFIAITLIILSLVQIKSFDSRHKNIYERVVLQSIRLSTFLRIFKWKSNQNICFVLEFALNISKLVYDLTDVSEMTLKPSVDDAVTTEETVHPLPNGGMDQHLK